MRPVRLDIDGFASFRRPTEIDFDDIDYFAFVGPTGSGKSTVIDAMVFALFGSAPRWDRRNAIAYALAPTANRATVKLVFDAGGSRYIAIREVRRNASGTVQQKSARLERFHDPRATGSPDDETTVLAGEVREMPAEIEKLLGLTFEDFCQCVVLPQGQFAQFLKATDKERQDILLKLLGAGHYERIRAAASAREGAAATEQQVAEGRLTDLRDATEADEEAATRRVAELGVLHGDLDVLLRRCADTGRDLGEATSVVDTVRGEQAVLAGLALPDGIADLGNLISEARAEVTRARDAEADAGAAHDRARDALEHAGDPTALERTRDQWAEASLLDETLPGLQTEAANATNDLHRQEEALQAAELALQQAQARFHQAETDDQRAVSELDAVIQRQRLLSSVTVPDGVTELAGRIETARRDLTQTSEDAEVAEAADNHARQRLAELGDPGFVNETLTWLDRRATLRADLSAQEEAVVEATRLADAAREAMADADAELERATHELERLRLQHRAADLRAQLEPGQECPVCAQTVHTLPPPLDAPTRAGEDAVGAAKAARRTAETGLQQARSTLATAQATRDATRSEVDRLSAQLDGRPDDPAALRAQVAAIATATLEATAAADALGRARERRRNAERGVSSLAAEQQAAREGFRQARSPLLAHGAPQDETDDLAAAWRHLHDWVTGRLDELDTQVLPAARDRADQARAGLNEARQAAQAAEKATAAARGSHRAATQRAAEATTAATAATRRRDELTRLLDQAIDAAAVTAALAHVQECRNAERGAFAALGDARRQRAEAEQRLKAADARAAEARAGLRASRDLVVFLGAPTLDETDLGAAWSTLLSWAREAISERATRLPELEARAESARQADALAARGVLDALQKHGLTAEDVTSVPTVLATATAQAQGALAYVRERRAIRARVEAELQAATERRQVAGQLAELLKANKFQKWLASAALDTLVTAASHSLRELSGGQFDLTHKSGEFFVIDHADAESERSVRTLSGGETFQASLSLALALSEQLSSLAAGAARLDSIFLDEGFGTLDSDSLEVVALTLERLAQGDRMVGIVTHVTSLAERVPVRFVVRRDSRSSSVTKEGL